MQKPYFILPFDHRSTFAKALLGFPYPVNEEQAGHVKEMKAVVFDAFLEAYDRNEHVKAHGAILVDLEFGKEIIERAKKRSIPFALSTEKSGKEVFEFEYGDHFGEVLAREVPTFAKALIRYDNRRKEDNSLQRSRLKNLSDFCQTHQIGLMIEPLMIGEGSRVDQITNCVREILSDGVTPTLWKLEGLDTATEWEQVRAVTDIDIIVLGRGENRDAVEQWIDAGKASGIVDGFAIGRTIFMEALEALRDNKFTREEAVQAIAKNYLSFVSRWQQK